MINRILGKVKMNIKFDRSTFQFDLTPLLSYFRNKKKLEDTKWVKPQFKGQTMTNRKDSQWSA